jgi:ADP-ribose pyrophosphatase
LICGQVLLPFAICHLCVVVGFPNAEAFEAGECARTQEARCLSRAGVSGNVGADRRARRRARPARHRSTSRLGRHPGGRRREPRVLLERQFRYAAKQRLWELPAGRIDIGESELAAAKRELREETGFRARRWQRAMFFWVSPGFLDETMAIYMASDLEAGAAEPEDDEVIANRFFPLSSAVRMALSGTIRDAKTIAAVLWLNEKSRSGKKSHKPRR